MFINEGQKGLIEFGRDEHGNLRWRIVFEVPLPSAVIGKDYTIFQDEGTIILTKDVNPPFTEYRGAISAMAKKFNEWGKMSENMWR